MTSNKSYNITAVSGGRAASRPMLARYADSVYWMSRYVERAEHIARLLTVNSHVLTDVGDLAPAIQQEQWGALPRIMRMAPAPDGPAELPQRIARHMMLDWDNPSSVVSCIMRAHKNARGIRENISAELWEHINTLYWTMRSEELVARFADAPDEVYQQVMTGSMLFQGLTDQTMEHEQRWLFTQLAKYMERIDVTARVIETKFEILRAAEESLETPIRNIHWMAVLRSCCSIEAFRWKHLGDMDPHRIAGFLLFESRFPRSIRYSVRKALEAISRIRAEVNPGGIDSAERIIGRLDAQLEYAEMHEVRAMGLPQYMRLIQNEMNDMAAAIQKRYFLH